ncbi:YciI family protein [Chitinolyticbacter meiyuanensis]|uniref:YciI family protein n=1 Tax=Chitinolyticbacter meiyuanensis TaxID=682798 RepID=UPI0011E5B839|nr:YciI family protein [Chitinolyticbacter meiyuanensis]
MRYIVQFRDNPDTAVLRREHLEAHLGWLHQHAAQVLAAGSLWPDGQEVAEGGLWIVEADSAAQIRELLASDPFWLCGLRAGVEIWQWRKAFPELNVPV